MAPSSLLQHMLVELPRNAGESGLPIKLIELATTAKNAAENRADAIATVPDNDQLSPRRRPQHLTSSRLAW